MRQADEHKRQPWWSNEAMPQSLLVFLARRQPYTTLYPLLRGVLDAAQEQTAAQHQQHVGEDGTQQRHLHERAHETRRKVCVSGRGNENGDACTDQAAAAADGHPSIHPSTKCGLSVRAAPSSHLHHPQQALLEREDGDDELGRVTHGRVHQAGDGVVGVLSQLQEGMGRRE